jgi:hypothetical protein
MTNPDALRAITITIDKNQYTKAKNVGPNPLFGGLLTNTLGNDASQLNAVEFAFDAPFTADCLLEFDYAAARSRPVIVYFNSTLINQNALAGMTGAKWTDLLRAGVGRVSVVQGRNTILVWRDKAIPHLGNITLTRLDGLVGFSAPSL